jgi:glycosyltransferase involved in cell wall biosynthesis
MSARPAPIAFFLPSLRDGGAERVTVNLVEGILQRGLAVDVVLANATGPYLGLLAAEARVVNLKSSRVLRSLLPLVRYLRRERPRAVISSLHHANLVALWAARLAGSVPVVAAVHSTISVSSRLPGKANRVLFPFLIRTFYPWASGVVAVSRGTADDLARTAGVPRDRIEVIYNPVITPALLAQAQRPPNHPWYAPGQPPVILAVGRLTPTKDFPTLIRAFAEVRRQCPARLLILGEGEERDALTALAGALNVGEDVALPGFQEGVPGFMARARLFVLSSVGEALPTVLIEALAAGVPVVSTDCPSGPREILQGGRLGALVPVGDPPALARAILEGLQRPASPVPPSALTPFTSDAAVDHYLRVVEKA